MPDTNDFMIKKNVLNETSEITMVKTKPDRKNIISQC